MPRCDTTEAREHEYHDKRSRGMEIEKKKTNASGELIQILTAPVGVQGIVVPRMC
jgi:hypothetical protein